jgi:hypothetical protein
MSYCIKEKLMHRTTDFNGVMVAVDDAVAGMEESRAPRGRIETGVRTGRPLGPLTWLTMVEPLGVRVIGARASLADVVEAEAALWVGAGVIVGV